MKRFYLFLSILFLTQANVYAQTNPLIFEHLSVRNGLPADYVKEVVQDNKGFLWFNSLEKLVRYDGYQVKSYSVLKDKGNIWNTYISKVIIDSRKQMWVCTYGGRIYLFDQKLDSLILKRNSPKRVDKPFYYDDLYLDKQNRIWSVIYSKKGVEMEQFNTRTLTTLYFGKTQKGAGYVNADSLNTIVCTASGDLWMGSNNGLYQYDEQRKTFNGYLTSTDTIGRLNVRTVYQAPSDAGTLWLTTKLKKDKSFRLCSFNLHYKMYKICSSIPGFVKQQPQFVLHEDRKKRFWYSSTHGLTMYDRLSGKATGYPFPENFRFKEDQNNYKMLEDRAGKFWLSSNFGVYYFDPETGRYQQYNANPSRPDALAHNHVTQVFQDRSGEIWIAMDEYGIDRVNRLRTAFTVYKNDPLKSGTYPENVTAVVAGKNGNVYLSAQDGGIYEGDLNQGSFRRLYKGDRGQAGKLIATRNGSLYFSMPGFLNILQSNGNILQVAVPEGQQITKIIQDKSSDVYILTSKSQLYRFNKSKQTLKLMSWVNTQEAKILTKQVSRTSFAPAAVEDKKGTLWVYHASLGVCQLSVTDSNATLSAVPNTANLEGVSNLYEDNNSRFWISSLNDGMWLIDRKTGKIIRHITTKQGLASNRIVNVTDDNDGNLWLATERGLTKYNAGTNSILNYTSKDNIPFDVPVTVIKGSNGKFIMCMFNSMLTFSPADLKNNAYPPQIAVESMTASDATARDDSSRNINTFGEPAELPHNQNRVTFNYAALHYSNPANNQYAYLLEGYDKQWTRAGTQRSVTYNNLAPGTYTFRVKAANSDGVWNDEGTSYTFEINKPWYTRWWAWLLYLAAFGLALRYYIDYRSRHLKEQNNLLEEKILLRTGQLSDANIELQARQEEITAQRDQLAETVDHLKTTQTQLIQSEKMASLGELTAGIAHEIQNPLNFVNNFSEVSIELVEEMSEELARGDVKEAMEIATDIRQNLGKINQHGKRADSIVKGMLLHSRTSSGEKQSTNINTLADEFLKLSYHGLRAKNKSFNAELVTNFRKDLPPVNAASQDIGRVLLNLFNNAFYAVQQKQRIAPPGYKPTVEVTTNRYNSPTGLTAGVIITIKDNGTGIPDKIKDKIMQPFFTTKPTGEGTGLGLSLSYDIVVKGHGGRIDVRTKEGEYTEFVISLPV